MARGFANKKIELYSLHARIGEEPTDYTQLFDLLSAYPAAARQHLFGGRLIAIPTMRRDGNRVFIHALEGDVNVNPMIYDQVLVEARTESLEQNEVLVHKTHAILDLGTRDAVVEYNQRGAKASDLAFLMEVVARRMQGFEDLTLDLNPVAGQEFEEAIERFERIRLASVKLARPNADWTDRYNQLTGIAAESGARFIQIEVVAGRSRSLEKSTGVINQIRELLRYPVSMFKGAKISGVRTGERAQTSISLERYIEHQRIAVKLTPSGHVDVDDIESKMVEFLNSRVA